MRLLINSSRDTMKKKEDLNVQMDIEITEIAWLKSNNKLTYDAVMKILNILCQKGGKGLFLGSE